MAKQAVETIWDYLESLGYDVVRRPEKKTVHLVLESEKMNGAQEKRLDKLDGVFSEKLDGLFSMVTVVPCGSSKEPEIRHWNRTGKAMPACKALDGTIYLALSEKVGQALLLISEVTSDDPLAKLSGHLNPNRTVEHDFEPTNMQDNFHDVITLSEFINGKSTEPFYSRHDLLERLFEDPLTHVNIIPMYYGSLEDAHKYAEDIWAMKGEGVVYANPHGGWVAGKRDETKIKLKEKLSYDVTVIGMCSGKKGSKYEHTLGKLLVAFRAFGDPEGEFIIVPISGMTDAQRDDWWNHPDHIIGACVKMDAKSFTENGNLREPRYKETRYDKESQFSVKVSGKFNEFTKAMCEHRVYDWS